MTTRDRVRRSHSPSIFTLVALCFLLPFATVTFVGSCSASGYGRTSFTGMQLVTRTVPSGRGTGECSAREVNNFRGDAINTCVEQAAATTAEIAFAAAIVGLLLGVLGVAGGPGWCAAVGLAALVQIPLSLADYHVSPHAGYWLALVLFGWAGLLHLRRWWKRRPTRVGRASRYRPVAAVGVIFLAILSVLVGLELGRLWLVPLLWAGGLYLNRVTKPDDTKPISGPG
jgi:hypothetical protein